VLLRRKLAALSSSCLALLISCGADPPHPVDRRHVASEACPLKTPADWQRFIERTVENQAWVTTCSVKPDCDGAVVALMASLQTDVLDTLTRCAVDLADNPPIASCTARLRRFIPAWVRQHARGSYGFNQENAEYLAAQTSSETPSAMMNPPAAIIRALPERALVEQAARDNGWPYLTHDGCLGGTRTFVTVADPEDRFEQWMLVGLDADRKLVGDGSIMSFIGVQKRDARGKKLAKVRLHFRDYVVANLQGSWQLLLPREHTGKCFGCHQSGMRLLVPTHGSVTESAPVVGESEYGKGVPPDFGFQRLAELNQRLLSYGLPDWNGSIDPTDFGPALGASLGCTSCHNGVLRGVLTVATDEETLKRKIVDELSMRSSAPGKEVPNRRAIGLLDRSKAGNPPLSVAEQAELDQARAEHSADYEAFVAQRFPTWKAWALAEPCQ
jgi:hypothetical protein